MSEILIDSLSYDFNELNQRVFINTNNPEVKSQVQKKNDPFPSVKPPFPPPIDPKDLLIIGKDNKPTRSPNAFIIYRKVFFKTVRNEGHILPMTAISSMASQSWEQESDEVRKFYKNIAKEAYNYRNECFPKKINKRKKKEKWNIISFKNNDSNDSSSNNNDSSDSGSNTSYSPSINDDNILENVNYNLLNMRLPTATEDVLENPLIDAFMQIDSSLLQKLVSNEFSLNNNDSVHNDIQINNSINHLFDIDEFLNLPQKIYPNSNLSLNDESNLAFPYLNELINSFPNENLQQIEHNNEQIDLIIDNNNFLTDLNSFDNLKLSKKSSFGFVVNDDDIIAENFDLFVNDLTQRENDLGLGITLANEEFEKIYSL
jgi:hypothetical protein